MLNRRVNKNKQISPYLERGVGPVKPEALNPDYITPAGYGMGNPNGLAGVFDKLRNGGFGKMWTYGNAAVQGLNALSGAKEFSKTKDRAKDLASDITLSAANSPTVQYDLTADQRKLLRELQRGEDTVGMDVGDLDLMGILGDVGMGVLTGLPGGIPGMVVGGVGGLVNSGLGDFNNAAANDVAELEALYQAVSDSEQYHNQMRKQRAYANLY